MGTFSIIFSMSSDDTVLSSLRIMAPNSGLVEQVRKLSELQGPAHFMVFPDHLRTLTLSSKKSQQRVPLRPVDGSSKFSNTVCVAANITFNHKSRKAVAGSSQNLTNTFDNLCVCLYMYIHMYLCTCKYTEGITIYVCLYLYVNVCIYICTCICMCICKQTYIRMDPRRYG